LPHDDLVGTTELVGNLTAEAMVGERGASNPWRGRRRDRLRRLAHSPGGCSTSPLCGL